MPADDVYWSPTELESEESSSNIYKSYIDPWDLENYAYIREHLDSLDLSTTSSEADGGGGGGEMHSLPPSAFSYTSHQRNRPQELRNSNVVDKYGSLMKSERTTTTTSNYAAIDEIRDTRDFDGFYYGPKRNIERRYSMRNRDYGHQSVDESLYGDVDSMSHIYAKRRQETKIPAAKIRRRRSYSYSQGDYGYEPLSSYQIYSRLEDIKQPIPSSPIYDDIRQPTPTPTNFGLSNYGHLKIDYSYSWNTLNKFIYN
ncbi:uncharacterized protein [Onthophagus taurus]|uniref:uncharacterized protein n=1 Tax=Onthophagus taurus TaxID=166361 RepID=UPI000C204A83|nr:uncharacterized protein LOC111425967 [Onthophagus taurus]